MKPLGHILVGVDFSPSCRPALREAVRWAAFDKSRITAVHVMENNLASQLKQALGLDHESVLQQTRDRLLSYLAELGDCTKDVQAEVRIGDASECLEMICKRDNVDLLVLGSRGMDHHRQVMGQLAEKCLRKAPVDVLLVKPGHEGPFHRVLACVDFSDTSARGVRFAAHVASHDAASLDALYVNRSSIAMAADYGVAPLPPISLSEDAKMWRASLEDFVDPLVDTYPRPKIECVVREEYHVRDAVSYYARQTQPGLVVLGTRGKTDLRTLFMGTTAETILESAPCSILAVKPETKLISHPAAEHATETAGA